MWLMMSLLSDDASYLFSPREEEEEEEGTAGSTCAAAEEDEEEDEKRGEDSEEVDAKRERNARRRTRALDMSLEFVFTLNEFVGKGELDFRTIRSRYARLSIKTKLYSND